MEFWKLHGIGNDFIAIDDRFDALSDYDYSDLAKRVCNRKLSVGADGLLIVKKSHIADVKMVYYNSDGSKASMCGNGLRCFSRFVYEKNIIPKSTFTVSTLDGIKNIDVLLLDKKLHNIKVDMGSFSYLCEDINMNTDKSTFINEKIVILDKEFEITSILMGVPHTIIFVDELYKDEVYKYGSLIEKFDLFKEGTNVNFVKVNDKSNISVLTWERGCGYTLGCGTGMTASAIVSKDLGKTNESINVSSEGGMIKIDILETIYMTGEAVKICEGTLEV